MRSPPPIDTAARHACAMIARHVNDEFPALHVAFAVYRPLQAREALAAALRDFERHPACQALRDKAAAWLESGRQPQDFRETAMGRAGRIFPFRRPSTSLAACFISLEDNDSVEVVRRQAYFHLWFILNTWRGGTLEAKAQTDPRYPFWQNMLADAFSALMLESTGSSHAVRDLGLRRCRESMMTQTGFYPEHYPFPLIIDACQIALSDAPRLKNAKTRPLAYGLSMAEDIAKTCDMSQVSQWQSFCAPAQDMAWAGADERSILGAAIHASEDPYARAAASMLAEKLEIDPALSIDSEMHNPFSDPEVAERHHLKLSEKIFMDALSRAALQNTALPFIEAAQARGRAFLQGRPVGCCAGALARAAQGFLQGRSPVEQARHGFDAGMADVPWARIQQAFQTYIARRRAGESFDERGIGVLLFEAGAQDMPDIMSGFEGV